MHEIIISQKYLPSTSEGNFPTTQLGKFLHIDKGWPLRSVCYAMLREDYVMLLFLLVGTISLICTIIATVQPSDMANKFKQVHSKCGGRVCVRCYQKADRTISSKEVQCIDSCLNDICTVILTFPVIYSLTVTLNWTWKSTTMNIILFLKCKIMIEDNRSISSPHWIVSSGFALLQIWQVWHTNEWWKREKEDLQQQRWWLLCAQKSSILAFNKFNKEAITLYNKVYYKVSRVEDLVNSPTIIQRVASRAIKNHTDTSLSTLGQKKKLIRISAEASTTFASERLFGFQADLNLSDKQSRVLAGDFIVATGWRKTVEHGFKESK